MKLENFVSTTFLIALLTVVLFVGVWQIKPAQGTTSFASGWELSAGSDITDTGIWNGTHVSTSYLTVNSTIVKSGTYSLKLSNSNGGSLNSYLNSTFSSKSSAYVGLDWYCTAVPTAVNKMVNFIGIGIATYPFLFNIGVVYNGSGAIWRLWDQQYDCGTNQSVGAYVVADTWYRLVFNGSNVLSDKMSLWVDGALTVTSTWVNGANQQFTHICAGSLNTGGGYGSNYVVQEFFDNVAIGSSYADVETWADYSVPTFSVGAPTTTKVGTSCDFSCNISDDVEVDFGIFGTNNTGVWVNETAVDISAVSAWLNVTKTLNATVGNVVQYRWYANDTAGNWASSAMQSLTLDSGTYYLTINSIPVAVTYTINGTISGASVTAASGSPSDIQTGIDTIVAAGGGTVYIPAGTFTFNPNTVNITFTTVPINIIGAGIGITTLQETTLPAYAATSSMFKRVWIGQNYNGSAVRISGISFVGFVDTNNGSSLDDWNEQANNAIAIKCTQDFRIDHCSFQNFCGSAIYTDVNTGGTYKLVNRGVIDHCTFDNPYRDALQPHNATGAYYSLGGYGIIVVQDSFTWTPNIQSLLGNYYPTTTVNGLLEPQPTYIEDCNFSRNRHAVAATGEGYYVVRNCHFEKAFYASCDLHPTSRGYELYGNTFNLTDQSYSNGQCSALQIAGGGGVTWNNTVILASPYPNAMVVRLLNVGSSPPYDVEQFYIWNNTAKWDNGTLINFNSRVGNEGGYTVNVNYFLRAPDMTNDSFTYTAYTYPHPLAVISSGGTTNSTIPLGEATYSIAVPSQVTSGGYTYDFDHWQDASEETTIIVSLTVNTTLTATYVDVSIVTVTILSPTNTTYADSTISVGFSATGGTIHQKWFNIKNGTAWVYTSNQTYPGYEMAVGLANSDHYALYAFANNTDGAEGYAIVMFTVDYEYSSVTVTWGGYWGRWWGYP